MDRSKGSKENSEPVFRDGHAERKTVKQRFDFDNDRRQCRRKMVDSAGYPSLSVLKVCQTGQVFEQLESLCQCRAEKKCSFRMGKIISSGGPARKVAKLCKLAKDLSEFVSQTTKRRDQYLNRQRWKSGFEFEPQQETPKKAAENGVAAAVHGEG